MSHQLDRLELEVRTADEALARQLLDRLGRLHRQELEEVLARVLDQLSPRGTRQRLERLELDLGEIPLDQLERQLPERLEQALRQALPPRLRTVRSKPTIPRPHASGDPPQRPSPPASLPRSLELLACFATTGTLPWWAPRDDARLIPATCAAALRLPPAILSPFLRQLATAPTARGRLLAAVPPAQRRLLREALGKATSTQEQPPADAPTSSEAIQSASPTPTRQPSSNNPDTPISSDRSDQHSHVPSPASSVDSLSPVSSVSSSPSPSPTVDTPRPADEATRSLSDATSLSSSRVTPSQPDSTPPTQQPGPNPTRLPSSISSSSTDQPTTPVHAATSPTVDATPARGENSRLLSNAASLSSSRVTPSQPGSTPPTQQPGPNPTRQPSSNVPDRSEASDSSDRSDRSDRSNQQSQVPGTSSPVGFVNPVSSAPRPGLNDDTPRPAGKAPRTLSDAASISSARVTPSQPASTPPTQQPGPNLARQPSSISSSSTDQPTTPVHAATSPTVGDTPARGESSRLLSNATSLSSSRVTPSQPDSTPPTQQLRPNLTRLPSSNDPDRSDSSNQQSQVPGTSSPVGSRSPVGFVNPVSSAPRPDPTGDITPPSAEPLLPFRPRLGESLTVDGAGLALLWPFLDTLFARLGWLTPEQRFVGAAEQQRAMALLGYLADGDPGPPEWRLTLAKLLCGLSLDAVYLLEEDLSEVERAEADKLLQAVLAHGDGLLGDEVDTLRATWLRRPGLLTWRPQAWLLVVERRSPLDGALDRLPWSASWLRLPWMAESVQVAW